MTSEAVPSSSKESPILNAVFTSSPVKTSSAVGLSQVFIPVYWYAYNFLLLLYVKKLIPSSAHFCVLLQNVDVFHYCVFALSANLVKMGPGIFCSNQNFPFRLITLCLYIPMSCMNTFSKSMAVSWGFFRELFFILRLLWSCFHRSWL